MGRAGSREPSQETFIGGKGGLRPGILDLHRPDSGYFCLRSSKKALWNQIDPLFYAKGTCSWFGGPEGDGVDEDEGLAFF
jgi:hypothetical protein